MKFAKTILLGVFTLSFVTTQTLAMYLPENTAIVADLDDVVIELDSFMKARTFFSAFPFNPLQWHTYIKAMMGIKNRYKKINGNRIMEDDNGNKINGAVFQLLYCAIKDKTLLPYIATLIQFITKHRRFIPGTKKILYYLKEKGYEIYFATNKDRFSFDSIAEKLGEEFTNLPKHVIVAQPGNDTAFMNQLKTSAQRTDLPVDFKALIKKAINPQPSDNIHHAPIPKPSSEYFDKLRNIVDEKKNIIFFDDRKENSTAATRPKDNMIGIHFENPIQFADELIKIGVLSEETDKEFLKDLRKPVPDNSGVRETISQSTKQMWNYIKSFYAGKEKIS